MAKILEKSGKSQGILSVRKSGNPVDSESETIATSTKSPRTEFNVILPLKDDKNLRYFRVRAGFQIFLCE